MRYSLSSGILVVVMCVALPARGTVMTYWDTKELTSRSTMVIRGKVVSQQEILVKGQIWTDSFVRVIEAFKGDVTTDTILTVRQPGGETIFLGTRVAGAARFSLDEEVLLFLRPVDQVHVVVGMGLGKYQVFRDPRGDRRARRDLSGVAFARFDKDGRFRMEHPEQVAGRARDRSYPKLVRAIRAHVRAGGAP